MRKRLVFSPHEAFDAEADDSCILGVGADGDGLAEFAGELALAIIGDFDGALLSGLDGILGVGRNGAAAAGDGLMDDEGSIAYVGEVEGTLDDGIFLGERAEVVAQRFELDFSSLGRSGLRLRDIHLGLLGLCLSAHKSYKQEEGGKNELLHHVFLANYFSFDVFCLQI